MQRLSSEPPWQPGYGQFLAMIACVPAPDRIEAFRETSDAMPIDLIYGKRGSRCGHSDFRGRRPSGDSLLAGRSAQERNARNTADHVAWLARRSATPGDRVHGMVDPARIGLAGHSAGGAVSFQAAVLSQEGPHPVAALCLLDAVPWQATLQAALHLKPIPVCSLRAEPSAFNAWDSGQRLVDAVTFHIGDIRVRGASHVDPENPSTTAARLVVGLSAERQAIFTRLMYLFFQDALRVRFVERPPTSFQGMLVEPGMAWVSLERASTDASPR